MNLASRGLRDLDGGPEAVNDALEREALKVQARLVYRDALVSAAALTGLALALPLLGG